ncbi:MAG TPA: hypothetical protein VJX67_07700 [Blastocatellia bacterium]|nr:hypothetical protein [Blastocatellia bacterium]
MARIVFVPIRSLSGGSVVTDSGMSDLTVIEYSTPFGVIGTFTR